MSNQERLAFAIISYLEDQIGSEELTEDAVESLEVAKQCLETAYGISLSEDAHLDTGRSLLDIFCDSAGFSEVSSPGTTIGLTFESSAPSGDVTDPPRDPATASAAASTEPMVTDEARTKAEEIKNEGNNMMKQERYAEAVEMYSKAIVLDHDNAVYYSNRAAGNNKLKHFQKAIDDCQKAISLDPSYSKAYGRMGLAYSGLNNYAKAKEAYQKACDLDPSNSSYQTNLRVAEEKMRDMRVGDSVGGIPGGIPNLGNIGPTLGGMDINSVLSNPALVDMATSLFQQPGVQAMMSNMMQQVGQSQQGGTGAPDMSGLFQVSNQLAQQLQQSNPQLVEQLRQTRNQSTGQSDPSQANNNNQPPPPEGDGSTS